MYRNVNKTGHVQVAFMVSRPLIKRIRVAAAKLEMDRSALIRQAVTEYLDGLDKELHHEEASERVGGA